MLALYAWARQGMASAVVLVAQVGVVAIPLVLIGLWLLPGPERPRRRTAVLGALLAGALAVAVVGVLDLVGGLGRDRPFVALGLSPLFPHAPDSSFPSDHTLVAAALALSVLGCRRVEGLLCLAVALLVGAARVAAAVHYPSDVLGSVLLALLPASAGLVAAAWLFRRPPVRRLIGDATKNLAPR